MTNTNTKESLEKNSIGVVEAVGELLAWNDAEGYKSVLENTLFDWLCNYESNIEYRQEVLIHFREMIEFFSKVQVIQKSE